MKLLLALLLMAAAVLRGAETNDLSRRLDSLAEGVGHTDAKLSRQLNELLWFQRLGDVAHVDKIRFAGPPAADTNGIAPPAGSNDVIVSAMTFLPRNPAGSRKLPLVVFVHGEIHGNAATDEEAVVVRELVGQGYAVVAPDYRGSSGYGGDFWRQIDYGGLEIEDVHAARKAMLDLHSGISTERVGMVGWSHGGAIAFLTVVRHPEAYQACYAGVPVSDLEGRIRAMGKAYEEYFAARYHVGKTLSEAPEEYRRRSPVWNVEQLRTPLLVHANTSDTDVPFSEVRKLLEALEASGKPFEQHIYTNAPGGHYFNRLDTPLARESRAEIWRFLARRLQPAQPWK
jgi:dipeptidyl aminopeptidase/acylaminoacyl peptidase